MKIEGCIFDMDGTLLDSMHQWRHLAYAYMKERGYPLEKELDPLFLSMGFREVAEYLVEHYPLPHTVDQVLERCLVIMEEFYETKVTVKPHVIEFLQEMQRRQIPMCIATATDRHMAEKAIRFCGLEGYFLKVFTTSEVGQEKDHPHIYDQALAFLDTSQETTFVFEDALYAATTAKRAGYHVIGVHDDSAGDCREEMLSTTDFFAEHFGEILPWLDGVAPTATR